MFSKVFLLGWVFSVLSKEIGWEERLRNDLFCVEWDVKPQLSSVLCEICTKCRIFKYSLELEKVFFLFSLCFSYLFMFRGSAEIAFLMIHKL